MAQKLICLIVKCNFNFGDFFVGLGQNSIKLSEKDIFFIRVLGKNIQEYIRTGALKGILVWGGKFDR